MRHSTLVRVFLRIVCLVAVVWPTIGFADLQAVEGELPPTGHVQPSADDWRRLAEGFEETARTVGFQSAGRFSAFLDQGLTGETGNGSIFDNLAARSVLFVVVVILLGGLTLNLTPCVLPMIPINLAIIGAGAQAGSKTKGFLLGATYGGAIAAAYGVLGVVVVLTGATFGTLNASPWFNLAIAAIFILLALAMIGVFNIDFSSLGSKLNIGKMNRGSFGLAAFMGGISALLAGACIAPVVIAVLLLSAQQYSQGNAFGLIYPFLLGLGMGLPWPFAGAGLSFLPKPGAWMNKVKYAFGAFVLLMGLYYGYLGASLLKNSRATPDAAVGAAAVETGENDWHTDLATALAEAKRSGRPLLLDFWATWCRNCLTMDRTTLKDEDIVQQLEAFTLLKFQAENPRAPDVAPVMDYFDVQGLPTYIVIRPRQ